MFVKYNCNINLFCHIHTINLNIWYIHSPTISKLMKNDLVFSKSQSRTQSNACSTPVMPVRSNTTQPTAITFALVCGFFAAKFIANQSHCLIPVFASRLGKKFAC